MVSWIKTLFKSGIITDYLAGTLSSKPDNTIERIVCLRYADAHDDDASPSNVVVSIQEPTQLVNSVLCAVTKPQRTSYFDAYDTTVQHHVTDTDDQQTQQHHQEEDSQTTHAKTLVSGEDIPTADIPPFFRSSQQMILESLFGVQHRDAVEPDIRGRVYIEYWYESTRHVMYYTVPDDTVAFPIYRPSTQDTVVLLDDDDILQTASFVVETPHGGRRALDITTTLSLFIGPRGDFHGRNRRGVDMAAILDYHALYGPDHHDGTAPRLLPSQLIGSRQRIELVYLDAIKTIT
jgi:hypothetical protein